MIIALAVIFGEADEHLFVISLFLDTFIGMSLIPLMYEILDWAIERKNRN